MMKREGILNMTKSMMLLTVLFFCLFSLCQADCNYLVDGDLNRDCRVNLDDFAMMAANWLVNCNAAPFDPPCRCDIPWVAEAPMAIARDSFAAGVIDGKIYVFGGNGNPDGTNLNSAEVYDPAMQQWTSLADNNHNNGGWGVEELTAAVVNDKLYVFGAWGGTAPDGYYGVTNFNEMYDPLTDAWTTLAQKPTPCAAAPTTVYNNEIYLFGGYFDSENPAQDHVNYDIVECYTPGTNTWRTVTTMPKVISNFGIATIGTKAYLFGGVEWVGEDLQFHNEVITYDFETNTWANVGSTPVSDGMFYWYGNAAPVVGGKVYLVGRASVSDMELALTRIVDIYDPATNIWSQSTSLPLPLDAHATLTINGRIYAIGGKHSEAFESGSIAEVISLFTYYCAE